MVSNKLYYLRQAQTDGVLTPISDRLVAGVGVHGPTLHWSIKTSHRNWLQAKEQKKAACGAAEKDKEHDG